MHNYLVLLENAGRVYNAENGDKNHFGVVSFRMRQASNDERKEAMELFRTLHCVVDPLVVRSGFMSVHSLWKTTP